MTKIFETVTSYFIAVVFSYAFILKVQNFEDFARKLYQSELINNDLVPTLIYALPIFEVALAMCILFDIKRELMLYISMGTLIVYTIYLIVLNEGSLFNGCSCGGIFENLSYFQHNIANIFFVLLNILAILAISKKEVN